VPGIDPIPVAQPGGHGNRPAVLESGPALAAPVLAGSMLESDTVLSLDRPYASPRRTMPQR
jgi:hypothetical protein